MSKHNNKNKTIKIETTPETKNIKEDKKNNPKFPYIVGILYFVLLSVISYFLLYVHEVKYASTIIGAMFILYFVLTFLASKKVKNDNKQSILIPCKLLCIILGCTYLFGFASTGLQYFNEINIQSQNMFDVKHYATKILSYEDTDIYVDVANQKAFVIDNSKETGKISVFELLHENHFDISIRDNTMTFYDLADNLKFSYIANNEKNEIVIQYTENDTRYLSAIDATNFVGLLEEKDNYDTAFFSTDTLRLYISYNPNLIFAFTNNKVQVSEYDTISDTENSSYIDRINTFLFNHYDEEFILDENASAELLAEMVTDKHKVNLYSMQCHSCGYNYGKTDIAEIMNENTSYVFRLSIDSNVLKEGVVSNEKTK